MTRKATKAGMSKCLQCDGVFFTAKGAKICDTCKSEFLAEFELSSSGPTFAQFAADVAAFRHALVFPIPLPGEPVDFSFPIVSGVTLGLLAGCGLWLLSSAWPIGDLPRLGLSALAFYKGMCVPFDLLTANARNFHPVDNKEVTSGMWVSTGDKTHNVTDIPLGTPGTLSQYDYARFAEAILDGPISENEIARQKGIVSQPQYAHLTNWARDMGFLVKRGKAANAGYELTKKGIRYYTALAESALDG